VIAGNYGLTGIAPPPGFGGTSDVPLSVPERQLLCSVQKSFASNSNNSVIHAVAQVISNLMSRDAWLVEQWLQDRSFCGALNSAAAIPGVTIKQIPVAADGLPISANPVWNKCVRGTATLADIRSNKDMIYLRPDYAVHKTCGNYRTAGTNEWSYPGDAFLTITIKPVDGGQPLVTVPQGYALLKVSAILVSK
jgi:hypothetical protein